MAKLILKRFHCVIDTDEAGSESPYFLTYVADFATGRSELTMTRQGNWHNEVDRGEIWTVNHTVAQGFDFTPAHTLVLSAMVEEDEGLDIQTGELPLIQQLLDAKVKGLRDAGATQVNGTVAATLRGTFKSAIALALATGSGASDDAMGVKRVTLKSQPGELALVSFSGDTGLYRVRYGVA